MRPAAAGLIEVKRSPISSRTSCCEEATQSREFCVCPTSSEAGNICSGRGIEMQKLIVWYTLLPNLLVIREKSCCAKSRRRARISTTAKPSCLASASNRIFCSFCSCVGVDVSSTFNVPNVPAAGFLTAGSTLAGAAAGLAGAAAGATLGGRTEFAAGCGFRLE